MISYNIWAQLWPNPDVNGKVHISVVRDILRNLDLSTTFETIWTLVELRGVCDDLDKLATARAIRTQRNLMRIRDNKVKLAITAK